MPEAAMHECDSPVPREHKIRASGQFAAVKPEAQSHRVQSAPHEHFGSRVATPDPAHVEPALSRCENVRHHARPPASATIVRRHERKSGALMPGRIVTAPKRKVSRYLGWK